MNRLKLILLLTLVATFAGCVTVKLEESAPLLEGDMISEVCKHCKPTYDEKGRLIRARGAFIKFVFKHAANGNIYLEVWQVYAMHDGSSHWIPVRRSSLITKNYYQQFFDFYKAREKARAGSI
jgi:hypothetical protein